jgi:cytochrome c-type protein NapC
MIKWLVIGVVLGMLGLWTFSFTLHATSTQVFCVSCHEMQIPLVRLQATAHADNRHGLVAECADCHIPAAMGPKLVRKIVAAREVWGHFMGTIDTPEAYAAYRPVMQARERARMVANDSAECRGCHNTELWDLAAQSSVAKKQHQTLPGSDKTCINCHEGVAHPLPLDNTNLFGSL